jgi:hypothetical protein
LRLSISEILRSRYHKSRIVGTKERMCNTVDRLRSVWPCRLNIEYWILSARVIGVARADLIWNLNYCVSTLFMHYSYSKPHALNLPPSAVQFEHQHMLQHFRRCLIAGQQLSEEAPSTTLCWNFNCLLNFTEGKCEVNVAFCKI